MYQQTFDKITNAVSTKVVKRIEDNAFIPFDPANTDYQAYLKWVAQGNTAQPAS
jgi:hypothetical protein